jgi:hypothetical protein
MAASGCPLSNRSGDDMTEPWFEYRYEYVSGGIPIHRETGYKAQIFVVNRGGTEGVARGYLSLSGGAGGQPDLTVYESDEMVVFPGASASSPIVPLLDQDEVICWARIFTTSQNLVPSLQVFQDTTPLSQWIYYAPGDFSEFAIPYRPFPVPPIGPIESA